MTSYARRPSGRGRNWLVVIAKRLMRLAVMSRAVLPGAGRRARGWARLGWAGAAVPGPPHPDPRRRRGEGRPHRHRHPQRLRPPDAVRPRRRLPARHHQEGAHPLGLRRAAVVPARRHQRQVAPGPRRLDLGRVGRRGTATSGPVYGYQWRSWPTPDGAHVDQIAQVVDADPPRPGLAPAHRLGLERRRHPADGAGAVPRAVPVLRRRRPAVAASSTSAPPTSSSACRSTSRRTPC